MERELLLFVILVAGLCNDASTTELKRSLRYDLTQHMWYWLVCYTNMSHLSVPDVPAAAAMLQSAAVTPSGPVLQCWVSAHMEKDLINLIHCLFSIDVGDLAHCVYQGSLVFNHA